MQLRIAVIIYGATVHKKINGRTTAHVLYDVVTIHRDSSDFRGSYITFV